MFVHDEEQKILAEQSKQILTDSKRYDKPLATQIISYSTFFPAQEYHQQYYRKSWLRYKTYKT
ncbi:peptide-methionine (S)-S-oxide reductase, partial [Patescibacteria group bacterium]|nr:peptide-methionine (S)-S-oxide reductase [Patescibacteria group bacterium]